MRCGSKLIEKGDSIVTLNVLCGAPTLVERPQGYGPALLLDDGQVLTETAALALPARPRAR